MAPYEISMNQNTRNGKYVIFAELLTDSMSFFITASECDPLDAASCIPHVVSVGVNTFDQMFISFPLKRQEALLMAAGWSPYEHRLVPVCVAPCPRYVTGLSPHCARIVSHSS